MFKKILINLIVISAVVFVSVLAQTSSSAFSSSHQTSVPTPTLSTTTSIPGNVVAVKGDDLVRTPAVVPKINQRHQSRNVLGIMSTTGTYLIHNLLISFLLLIMAASITYIVRNRSVLNQ